MNARTQAARTRVSVVPGRERNHGAATEKRVCCSEFVTVPADRSLLRGRNARCLLSAHGTWFHCAFLACLSFVCAPFSCWSKIFIYDILLIVRTLKIKGRVQINYTWSGYHRGVPSASINGFNSSEADSKLASK